MISETHGLIEEQELKDMQEVWNTYFATMDLPNRKMPQWEELTEEGKLLVIDTVYNANIPSTDLDFLLEVAQHLVNKDG